MAAKESSPAPPPFVTLVSVVKIVENEAEVVEKNRNQWKSCT